MKIGEFSSKLKDFIENVLGTPEEEDEPSEDIEDGPLPAVEPESNIFTIDKELIDTAGGGPIDPNFNDPSTMG